MEDVCNICLAGHHQETPGSDHCDTCPKGKYIADDGLTQALHAWGRARASQVGGQRGLGVATRRVTRANFSRARDQVRGAPDAAAREDARAAVDGRVGVVVERGRLGAADAAEAARAVVGAAAELARAASHFLIQFLVPGIVLTLLSFTPFTMAPDGGERIDRRQVRIARIT